MYEIRPESIKTFITDRNVKLPRFQRKQTWDDKKNFQLCISLFKGYPIGVSILNVETGKGKSVRWLLDGRQRRNALTIMYEDPEKIYDWAKRFIGIKNNDQPSDVEEKFYEKISEYIEAEDDDDFENQNQTEQDESEEEIDEVESSDIDSDSAGLELLLEIIKIVHNKNTKSSGFTRPFDFTKYVEKLPYIDNTPKGISLSSKKLKTFIDEYRNYCDNEDKDYQDMESFSDFLNQRIVIKDEKKQKQLLERNWNAILERILMIEKIDNVLTNSKIGVIQVSDLTPSDAQKVFNIINSEGEKLTAVEILSAKPKWNIRVQNPTQDAIDATQELYKQIGIAQSDVVRWDLAATFLRRIGDNIVTKSFSDSKSDFEKELTCGFKILSGIKVGGVKKEDIEKLSKVSDIQWNTEIDAMIRELQLMLNLINTFKYFRFFKDWKSSIMELTSDAVALNFIILAYKDWCSKGKPVGSDSKAKRFQKNCFIMWDKLIYEYITRQWRGSSDSKIASNINDYNPEIDLINPISNEKWNEILNEIFTTSTIDSNDISISVMKPLLYHLYCLKSLQAPDDNKLGYEVDHIIPQTLFSESTLERKSIIQDNLLNLGLLPKRENISKSNKKLSLIDDDWLKTQIETYEFIPKDKLIEYSNINNYKSMFDLREEIVLEAFTTKRMDLINN